MGKSGIDVPGDEKDVVLRGIGGLDVEKEDKGVESEGTAVVVGGVDVLFFLFHYCRQWDLHARSE